MDAPIHWPADMDRQELEYEIARGGRFVFYEYCVSIVVASKRGASDIIFLHAEQSGLWQGLPWALLTVFFGWWGVPWGLIWTPMALYSYLQGGQEVTADVLRQRMPGE